MTDGEARLRARLVAAGWTATEKGAALGVPSFRYDNGTVTIELEKPGERQELVLTYLVGGGRALTVYPVYGDDEGLERTVDAVVEWQDRVDEGSVHEAVRAVVRACPEVYAQVDDEDEPVLLTDD
jgi:hypothetical protein